MTKVIAFTSGKNTPSANYRIRQYIERLRARDIFVDDFYPFIDKNTPPPFIPTCIRQRYIFPYVLAWNAFKLSQRIPALIKQKNYDIAWLNRELLPGYYSLERFIDIPYVLDFDDSIWMGTPWGIKSFAKLCEHAHFVTAGNNYLAEKAKQFTDKVIIVPTAVDTAKITPLNRQNEKFTIGWVGTSGNFKYLYKIEHELVSFIEDSNSMLFVVADAEPTFRLLKKNKNWVFRKWSLEDENDFLNKIDVGIMPLDNTEWEKGKCSFKMLQYMAAGKPVIVSPVGMNKDILDRDLIGFGAKDNEWENSLFEIFNNKEKRFLMGLNGRKLIEQEFSTERVSNVLTTILR